MAMGYREYGKNKHYRGDRGVVTLELLIAFALAVVFITGAAMVTFIGQSASLDTNLTSRGLSSFAATHLASTTAAVTVFWNDVSSGFEEHTVPFMATTTATIIDISPCMKYVGSDTDWKSEMNRGQNVSFQTFVANVAEAVKMGGGCDPFPLTSDWEKPQAYNFPPGLLHSGSHGTDVAIVKQNGKRLALLTTEFNPGGEYTLWIVDVTDPANPAYVSSYAGDDRDVRGIVAIQNYAFLASASTTAQLQIIDISDPASSAPAATAQLPNLTNGEARSIFYYDDKIYIGTQYVGCPPPCAPNINNEFHIYDVSNPVSPAWATSTDVDRNVNSIVVRDGIAYLAIGPGSSPPYTPFRVYDVRPLAPDGSPNPTYLNQLGSFEIPIERQGTSIYTLGNTAYLGLQRTTSGKDFYVIDVSEPSTPQEVGAVDLGGNSTRVGDIVVHGTRAFLGIEGTNSQNTFQVWNVSDPTSLSRVNTCTAGNPYPQNLTGLVYTDNLIFASFRSNDALRIIYDTFATCF